VPARPDALQNLTLEQRNDLLDLITRSHNRPHIFIEHILGAKLRRWQRRACLELTLRLLRGEQHLRVLIRSCHGSGKTWFAASLLLWWMTTRPKARGLTTAPSWSGVENLLWPEIANLYNKSILRELGFGRVLTTELHLDGDDDPTWFAVGASSDRPEKLEGHHSPTAVIRVVDEAKAVDPSVYVSTKGMFTSPTSLDVWISTPTLEAGDFYERDVKGGDDVVRVVVDIDELIADPTLDEGTRQGFVSYKAEAARDWGVDSPEYQSRVLAHYIVNAEGQLYPSSWLERALEAELPHGDGIEEIARETRVHLDAAGSVDGDQNVLAIVSMRRYGVRVGANVEERPDLRRFVVERVSGWHERDTMKSKGRLLTAILDSPQGTIARVDTIGLGKGIYDAAAEALPQANFEEYRASDTPTPVDKNKQRFSNRKAEDSWFLRENLLEKGRLVVLRGAVDNLEKFRAQMRAVKYEILSSGKRHVVDPPDSPDYVDALVGACAAPRLAFSTAQARWL